MSKLRSLIYTLPYYYYYRLVYYVIVVNFIPDLLSNFGPFLAYNLELVHIHKGYGYFILH